MNINMILVSVLAVFSFLLLERHFRRARYWSIVDIKSLLLDLLDDHDREEWLLWKLVQLQTDNKGWMFFKAENDLLNAGFIVAYEQIDPDGRTRRYYRSAHKDKESTT